MTQPIDRKYRILAVNPVSGKVHDDNDAVLFLAKDKALPVALEAYRQACIDMGAGQEQVESVSLLIERVKNYQQAQGAKVADLSTSEAENCLAPN